MKVPREGGTVYSVAPVGEPDKVKHVHLSLRKVQNQKEPSMQSSQGNSLAQKVLPQVEEELEEADWLLVIFWGVSSSFGASS